MDNRERFKDAEWFSELNTNITIGGAGSLGSWLSLYLARTRPNRIMIYDDDKVEETNFAGQFYNYTNLGMYKVDGLYNNIRNYCNYSILKRKTRYEFEKDRSNTFRFTFACFDNIKSREEMFYNWLSMNYTNENEHALFMDCRLGFEYFQIYCVKMRKDDIERYINTFFDDSEVEDAPCSLKVNTFMPAMAASQMTAFYLNHLVNHKNNDDIRQVPFMYEFHTDHLLTVVENSNSSIADCDMDFDFIRDKIDKFISKKEKSTTFIELEEDDEEEEEEKNNQTSENVKIEILEIDDGKDEEVDEDLSDDAIREVLSKNNRIFASKNGRSFIRFNGILHEKLSDTNYQKVEVTDPFVQQHNISLEIPQHKYQQLIDENFLNGNIYVHYDDIDVDAVVSCDMVKATDANSLLYSSEDGKNLYFVFEGLNYKVFIQEVAEPIVEFYSYSIRPNNLEKFNRRLKAALEDKCYGYFKFSIPYIQVPKYDNIELNQYDNQTITTNQHGLVYKDEDYSVRFVFNSKIYSVFDDGLNHSGLYIGLNSDVAINNPNFAEKMEEAWENRKYEIEKLSFFLNDEIVVPRKDINLGKIEICDINTIDLNANGLLFLDTENKLRFIFNNQLFRIMTHDKNEISIKLNGYTKQQLKELQANFNKMWIKRKYNINEEPIVFCFNNQCINFDYVSYYDNFPQFNDSDNGRIIAVGQNNYIFLDGQFHKIVIDDNNLQESMVEQIASYYLSIDICNSINLYGLTLSNLARDNENLLISDNGAVATLNLRSYNTMQVQDRVIIRPPFEINSSDLNYEEINTYNYFPESLDNGVIAIIDNRFYIYLNDKYIRLIIDNSNNQEPLILRIADYYFDNGFRGEVVLNSTAFNLNNIDVDHSMIGINENNTITILLSAEREVEQLNE